MATTKKVDSKKQMIDEDTIIEAYMHDVLEGNNNENVYRFCKKNNMEEAEFYSFFGSLEAVKNQIWIKFFENAVAIIEKDKSYDTYTDKNKLLSLYFTFFEILTLNRSYVLIALDENENDFKNLKQLKHLRNRFKDFVTDIIETETMEGEINGQISKITKPLFSEGAWIQFLFILRFWKNDQSKNFEKTDIVIEKSVNTVVDLLNTKPLESLLDFGKFLWKETKMN